jgi:hypothetical protein
MTLDVERLHTNIEQHIERDTLFVKAPRGAGITTTIEQLMLAEVQLADAGSHFLYLTDTPDDAAKVQQEFVRLICAEPGIALDTNQCRQIRIRDTDVVFFFVEVDYFLKYYAFRGTRLDKIFVDVRGMYTATQALDVQNKLTCMQICGTEIV